MCRGPKRDKQHQGAVLWEVAAAPGAVPVNDGGKQAEPATINQHIKDGGRYITQLSISSILLGGSGRFLPKKGQVLCSYNTLARLPPDISASTHPLS